MLSPQGNIGQGPGAIVTRSRRLDWGVPPSRNPPVGYVEVTNTPHHRGPWKVERRDATFPRNTLKKWQLGGQRHCHRLFSSYAQWDHRPCLREEPQHLGHHARLWRDPASSAVSDEVVVQRQQHRSSAKAWPPHTAQQVCAQHTSAITAHPSVDGWRESLIMRVATLKIAATTAEPPSLLHYVAASPRSNCARQVCAYIVFECISLLLLHFVLLSVESFPLNEGVCTCCIHLSPGSAESVKTPCDVVFWWPGVPHRGWGGWGLGENPRGDPHKKARGGAPLKISSRKSGQKHQNQHWLARRSCQFIILSVLSQ